MLLKMSEIRDKNNLIVASKLILYYLIQLLEAINTFLRYF
jgi:hypothetical protein